MENADIAIEKSLPARLIHFDKSRPLYAKLVRQQQEKTGRNMKNIILLIILTLTFISCQTIAKKMYGIKDPGIENRKTIIKTANKYKLDTANILSVNSKDFIYVLKGKSIPNGAIYDKNGKYIEYRLTDTSCNAGLFQFIPALNLTDKYNQPDSANLGTELKKFRNLNGNTLTPLVTSDFYLVIYWTVWTGKLNKDHVKIWEDLAKNNKNCKIQVIKVNLDVQEWWNEDDKNKIINALSKNK
jgi:hypothetical protein